MSDCLSIFFAEDSFILTSPGAVSVELVTDLIDYDTLIWSPETDASYIYGLNPTLGVTSSQNYTVSIYDNAECSQSLHLRVDSVIVVRGYYIPNSFSTNGDGDNDYLNFLLLK